LVTYIRIKALLGPKWLVILNLIQCIPIQRHIKKSLLYTTTKALLVNLELSVDMSMKSVSHHLNVPTIFGAHIVWWANLAYLWAHYYLWWWAWEAISEFPKRRSNTHLLPMIQECLRVYFFLCVTRPFLLWIFTSGEWKCERTNEWPLIFTVLVKIVCSI